MAFSLLRNFGSEITETTWATNPKVRRRCPRFSFVRYAELRSALELSPTQMSEYFKVKSVQGQSSQGKVRENRQKPGHFFLGEGERDMENCALSCVCGPNVLICLQWVWVNCWTRLLDFTTCWQLLLQFCAFFFGCWRWWSGCPTWAKLPSMANCEPTILSWVMVFPATPLHDI